MRRTMTWLTVLAATAVGLAASGSALAQRQGSNADIQVVRGGEMNAPPDAAAQPKTSTARPPLRSTAEKRRWIRDQLANGVANKRERALLLNKVDRLTPRQIDVLTNAALAQQQAVDQPQQLLQQMQQIGQQQQEQMRQANQELARLQFIRHALENELWLRNAGYGVGYAPVVTWLPEGTWFGAAANISPDGRYTRINANPFFSSVGPVYTYNLNSGETRRWMPHPEHGAGYPQNYQSSYQQGGQPLGSPGFDHAQVYGALPAQHVAPAARPSKPAVWYDGVRTRVGP